MKNANYTIEGMSCNSCAMKIENAMNQMQKVHNAKVNFGTKTLALAFENEELSIHFLQEALEKIGNYTLQPFQSRTTTEKSTEKNYSPIIWGILGSIGISIIFYFIQTLGMQDWYAPLTFSLEKWYFIFPLIAGFGVQMGLFRAIHLKAKAGGGIVAASGGVSTSAMIACCLHNLVTLFPLLGLSGAAVFLAAYQDYIFGFSLLFVVGGMVYMYRKYKALHECCEN